METGREEKERESERVNLLFSCVCCAWAQKLAVAGLAVAGAHGMEARFYGCNGANHYEFEWDTTRARPTKNPNGTTGYAKVISRSGGAGGLETGCALRVHRCAWNPCQVVWSDNKYGPVGPPMHLQPSDWRPGGRWEGEWPPPAWVAEIDRREQEMHIEEYDWTLVPEKGPEGDPTDAEPPPEPPPPAAPPLPLQEPARQPLRPLSAAPPLPAGPVAAVAAQPHGEASAGGAPLAQLSESRVLSQILQLARDIRRPRSYIGYSALLCFGLARRCRPRVWEGETRIDLISYYAPWAIERCTTECCVDAVCCCLVPAVAGGHAEWAPVSATHPLDLCNHFVAAVPMADVLPGEGHSIQAYYSSLGMALLGTVVDGDCGIDVACQMVGLPQTAAQRALVREEPREISILSCGSHINQFNYCGLAVRN